MSLTEAEIEHLAKLARLELSRIEKNQFDSQLPEIIAFIDQLQEIKVEVEPTCLTLELKDLRSDEPTHQELGLEAISQLAPKLVKDQLMVPGVQTDG